MQEELVENRSQDAPQTWRDDELKKSLRVERKKNAMVLDFRMRESETRERGLSLFCSAALMNGGFNSTAEVVALPTCWWRDLGGGWWMVDEVDLRFRIEAELSCRVLSWRECP